MWDNNGNNGNGSGHGSKAVIGASISVKGEISGSEDLLIEGFVEGVVDLKKNTVTVASGGKVNASIHGKLIHVEGEVLGDLFGTEQVVVHRSGQVRGNISAPRVSLEDGARLKGMIDTDVAGAEASTSKHTPHHQVVAHSYESPYNGQANGKHEEDEAFS